MTDPDDVEDVETEPIVESDDRNDPDEESETETGRDDEIDDPDVESGDVNDEQAGVEALAGVPDGSLSGAFRDEPDVESGIVDVDIDPPSGDEPDDDDEIVDETETDVEPIRAADVSRPAGNGSDG